MELKEIERIKKVLRRRKMRILTPYSEGAFVVWQSRGKTKLGFIKRDYWHRYGVDTRATYGGRWWFKSDCDGGSIDDVTINLIEDFDPETTTLELLNVDKFFNSIGY